MEARTHEQIIADYDAQIERIKARRQAAIARNSKTERKARNHALIVAGGMLMRCFEGGWQSVDWQGLSDVISNNKAVFARHTTSKLPTAEASKRLRSWERAARHSEDAAKEATE